MEIVEEVMGETFMFLETSPILKVESAAINVTNDTSMTESLFLFSIISLCDHETVYHYCQENCNHDSMDDYCVNIFEDRKDRDRCSCCHHIVFLEEVTYETIDCSEGSIEYKSEAIS